MDEFCSLFSLVCSWLSLQGTSPRFGDGYCGASLHVKVRSPSITEDWTCSFYTIGSVRGKDILLPRSAVAQLDADTDSTMHGLRHTYLSPVLAELALVVLVGKGNVALLQPGTRFLVWDHHFAASLQHHWNVTCLILPRICSSNIHCILMQNTHWITVMITEMCSQFCTDHIRFVGLILFLSFFKVQRKLLQRYFRPNSQHDSVTAISLESVLHQKETEDYFCGTAFKVTSRLSSLQVLPLFFHWLRKSIGFIGSLRPQSEPGWWRLPLGQPHPHLESAGAWGVSSSWGVNHFEPYPDGCWLARALLTGCISDRCRTNVFMLCFRLERIHGYLGIARASGRGPWSDCWTPTTSQSSLERPVLHHVRRHVFWASTRSRWPSSGGTQTPINWESQEILWPMWQGIPQALNWRLLDPHPQHPGPLSLPSSSTASLRLGKDEKTGLPQVHSPTNRGSSQDLSSILYLFVSCFEFGTLTYSEVAEAPVMRSTGQTMPGFPGPRSSMECCLIFLGLGCTLSWSVVRIGCFGSRFHLSVRLKWILVTTIAHLCRSCRAVAWNGTDWHAESMQALFEWMCFDMFRVLRMQTNRSVVQLGSLKPVSQSLNQIVFQNTRDSSCAISTGEIGHHKSLTHHWSLIALIYLNSFLIYLNDCLNDHIFYTCSLTLERRRDGSSHSRRWAAQGVASVSSAVAQRAWLRRSSWTVQGIWWRCWRGCASCAMMWWRAKSTGKSGKPSEFRSGEPPKSRIRVGFGFRVSGFGFRVSGFGFRRLKPTFAVGFGFWVSLLETNFRCRFRGSGFGFRCLKPTFAVGFGVRVSGFAVRNQL